MTTATVISEALLAYNGERYQDALTLYRNAAATPAGEQLRVVNGLYLATWKLGRASEAEEAFGNVVAFGLRSNSLGVSLASLTLISPNVRQAGEAFRRGTTDLLCLPLLGCSAKNRARSTPNKSGSLCMPLAIITRMAQVKSARSTTGRSSSVMSRRRLSSMPSFSNPRRRPISRMTSSG